MGLAASLGTRADTASRASSSAHCPTEEVGPPSKRCRHDDCNLSALPPNNSQAVWAASPNPGGDSPVQTFSPPTHSPNGLAGEENPLEIHQDDEETLGASLLRLHPAISRVAPLRTRRRVLPMELEPNSLLMWPFWARPAMTVMDSMWLCRLGAPPVPFLDLVTRTAPPSRYPLHHGREGILLGVRSLEPLVWHMLRDEAQSSKAYGCWAVFSHPNFSHGRPCEA